MFFKKRKFSKLPRFYNKPINFFNLNIKLLNNNLIFDNNIKSFFLKIPITIKIDLNKNFLFISSLNNNLVSNCLIGTLRSIILNNILGFFKLFYKKLVLFGVGYKAILNFNYLYLFLGFSHPIVIKIPEFLDLEIKLFTDITISGTDKQKVNEFSYFIKKYRKPDSYKGKGIRFLNENLNLKEIKKK